MNKTIEVAEKLWKQYRAATVIAIHEIERKVDSLQDWEGKIPPEQLAALQEQLAAKKAEAEEFLATAETAYLEQLKKLNTITSD